MSQSTCTPSTSMPQGKSNDSEQEIFALKQQIIHIKEHCIKEREQNQALKQQIAKLAHTLEETEQKLAEGNKKAKEATSSPSTATQEQHAKLSKELHDSKQHIKQLERVIRFLRERAEGSHLELVQLREEFHNKQHPQQHHSSEELSKKDAEIVQLKSEKQKIEEEKLQLLNNFDLKKDEQDTLLNALKNHYEDQLTESKTTIEAYVQEMQEIQQHFAKKAKEFSLLTEQLEEAKIQMQELQQIIAALQSDKEAMQLQIEAHFVREQELHETIKLQEEQIRKWEEQYYGAYEKWQESETRRQELRPVEEKYHQAVIILNSLNGLLGLNNHSNEGRDHPRQASPFSTEPSMPKIPPQTPYKSFFD